jgi:hypothetical protein
MKAQQTLDLFVAETVSPERGWSEPPHASGSHSSYTGAQSVVECFTERQSELLQVLGNGSPMTRNELAAVMHWPLSSVCSVVNALIELELVEPTGDFDVQEFHGRTTRRERLKLTGKR